MLSNTAIKQAIERGLLAVTPFSDSQIDRAHIDLYLDSVNNLEVPAKTFLTALTREKVTIGESLCAIVEGRAALAKKGISVEQSSTFCEPGTDNKLTLEIFNASDADVTLDLSKPIAKMFIMKLEENL